MSVFSKYHRFREAGEQANVYNVGRFGEPVRSLFTSTKLLTLHHRITITDANGDTAYTVQSKAISLHDKTDISDAYGNFVAHIERKLLSFHERHYVQMADGNNFELSNELFHIFRDITNIEGLGWQLRGNIAALNFELYDERGGIIAVIGQKMISMPDKYCIDIYQPEFERIVIAILVTLQHMMRDRAAASSSASSSSSSGG